MTFFRCFDPKTDVENVEDNPGDSIDRQNQVTDYFISKSLIALL